MNKDLESAQNLAYFTKKIFTTARLFALVSHCQALLRAQCHANPPTHMHEHTCMQELSLCLCLSLKHTYSLNLQMSFLFSSYRKFVFFNLFVKGMKLQELDRSHNLISIAQCKLSAFPVSNLSQYTVYSVS